MADYTWKFLFVKPPYNSADEAALIGGKAWKALSAETHYAMCKACDLKELLEKRSQIQRMILEGHVGPIYCNSANDFLMTFALTANWMYETCYNDSWKRYQYITEVLDLLEKLGPQDKNSYLKDSYESLLAKAKRNYEYLVSQNEVKRKVREIELSRKMLNDAFSQRIEKIKECIHLAQTSPNYALRLEQLSIARRLYDEGTPIREAHRREEFFAFLPQILALEKCRKKWKGGNMFPSETKPATQPAPQKLERQGSLEKLRAKQKDTKKSPLPTTQPSTATAQPAPVANDAAATGAIVSVNKHAIVLQTMIGEGATSVVHRGTWNGRVVAIKRFHCTELRGDQAREFNQEATLSISLRSPYLIETYDYVAQAPYFCTIMEYMPQGSLYQLLGSDLELSWDKRWVIAMDIACGVEALHSKDIIHRDIKSLNVLIGHGFRAKLADFGQAKCKHASQNTSSGRGATGAVGTIAWLAPEVLRDGVECSQPTDIYSLGMVLWELATREIPFAHAANLTVLSLWIMQGKRENLTKVTQPKLSALIQHCWEANPALRPSAARLRKALEDATPKHVSQETPRVCLFSQ